MKDNFGILLKALKNDAIDVKIGSEGISRDGKSTLMNNQLVVHHNDITTIVEFEDNGDDYYRVIKKNGKVLFSSNGIENSLMGAYSFLSNPKNDIKVRIASIEDRISELPKARTELLQLKVNAYKSVLDRL